MLSNAAGQGGVGTGSLIMQDVSERTTVEMRVLRWPFTVTVALPAFNEAHSIAQVIADVRAQVPDA